MDTIKRNLVCLGRPLKKTSLELIVSIYDYNKKPPTAGKTKNAVASSDPKSHSPQENIWFALRASKEKRAHVRSISEKNLIVEHLYRNARTYFSKSQQIITDVKWKKEDNLRNQPRRLPAEG